MEERGAVEFLRWALPRCGYRYEGFRRVRRQVLRRLRKRCADLGLADLAAYRRHLEAEAAEWTRFDALLNVTISRFYRDRALWDLLRREILPALARRGTVRCWSAGCASGEEPYTLAIVGRGLPLRILATDRNPEMLRRARAGVYRASSLRDLPTADRELAFTPTERGFRLREAFREAVRFREADVRRDLPAGPFDLVFCRYLAFTYFAEEVQREVLRNLEARLVPDGLLALGRHERLPAGAAFERCAPGVPLFRRLVSSSHR